MPISYWQIGPKHLGNLDDKTAVDVLRNLLCAEAARIGLSVAKVNVPSDTALKDGGIDGEARDVPDNNGDILIPGHPRYQVKTGRFGTTETFAKKLLLRERSRRKRLENCGTQDLLPRVRECFEDDNAFVVVLFGSDAVDSVQTDSLKKRMQEGLAKIDSRFANCRIEILRSNQLSSLINRFPAIALSVKDDRNLPVYLWEEWAKFEAMQPPLFLGPSQSAQVAKVRSALRRDNYRTAIRILGEPGIGKTRLALETLADSEYKPFVLYTDQPSALDSMLPRMIREAPGTEVVLVVDECSLEYRRSILDKLSRFAPAIRIITIFQEQVESSAEGILEVERLPTEQILQILKNYHVAEEDLRLWAEGCQGSPRVAHLIGKNLRDNPNLPFHDPDNIWDLCIASKGELNTPAFEKRKLVLSCVALFTKFGYAKRVANECDDIYQFVVRPLDHTLSKNEFKSIVDSARKLRILQGETTLYLTPKLLHIWLWKTWWDRHGPSCDLTSLYEQFSPPLRKWFAEMIQYAKESSNLVAALDALFAEGGPLQDLSALEKVENRELFFHVAQANAERTLDWLEATLGQSDIEQLKLFTNGRREVVSAIQRIAMTEEHFHRAAFLLVRLAEAENEEWDNNATGVFADLFSLTWGRMATTEAAPQSRLKTLVELLRSPDTKKRNLALAAFDKALDQSYVRIADVDRHGLRRKAHLWHPGTYGELAEAYKTHWRALEGSLEWLSEPEKTAAAQLLLSHARSWCSSNLLADTAITTLKGLAQRRGIDTRQLLEVISSVLAYDRKRLSAHLIADIEQLRDGLVGKDFGSRARRYVGMNLIDDHFDDDGKRIHGVVPEILELANEAVNNRDALIHELGWLVTNEAENGFHFGQSLGHLDPQGTLFWPSILTALAGAGEKGSDFFIGGFLRSIFEKDAQRWESAIDDLFASTAPKAVAVSAVWRSGMTPNVALRILSYAKNGDIAPETMGVFAYGQASIQIQEDIFLDWVRFLISREGFGPLRTALELMAYRYHDQRQVPDAPTRDLLFHNAFVEGVTGRRSDSMTDYHWTDLAKKWAGDSQERLGMVAARILENLANDASIFEQYRAHSCFELVDRLLEVAPEKAWQIAARLIGPPATRSALAVLSWIGGEIPFDESSPSPLSRMPRDDILAWIDDDREQRASYLMRFVPKEMDPETWRISIAREILCRYGGQRNVQRALSSRFLSGGWVGPASLHYSSEKLALERLLDVEDNSHARVWFKEFIGTLEKIIEQEQQAEERDQ